MAWAAFVGSPPFRALNSGTKSDISDKKTISVTKKDISDKKQYQ
jgi:hypothetical protein